MHKRLLFGFLFFVPFSLLVADDKAKPTGQEKSSPPAKESPLAVKIKELSSGFMKENEAFFKTYQAAATDEQRKKMLESRPKADKIVAEILQLARDHAADPEGALDAIESVFNLVGSTGDASTYSRQALELLQERYVKSEKIGAILPRLPFWSKVEAEKLLRDVIAQNPVKDNQGKAVYYLATQLKSLAEMIRYRQIDKESVNSYKKMFDKKNLDHINASDPEKLEAEALALYETILEKYPSVEYRKNSASNKVTTLADRATPAIYELKYLSVGKKVPELVGKDLDDKPLRLSDYQGKVVVIDFWATWCGPCMAMIPHAAAMVKRLENKPFAMLGVNSDPEKDNLKPILEKNSITWPSWWNGPDGPGGPIATKWNVFAWPTTYVIDSKGIIRFKNLRDQVLEDAVNLLLAEMEKPGSASQPSSSR